jgi:6-phosphofructokinase 1
MRLAQAGLRIITLPKTIDNDIACTDVSFGFDTALQTATEAIDRLHSTATSHDRVIVLETMGHRAGWLALGAGIAGGADVVLIPEIPYRVEAVADAIRKRVRKGKRFSIVAVAEGSMTVEESQTVRKLAALQDDAETKEQKRKASADLDAFRNQHVDHTVRLTQQLEQLAGLESRLTILGHLQRGGTPSAADRILATRLGTACAQFLRNGLHGIMVASVGGLVKAVPLDEVAGKKNLVPVDGPLVESARRLGTCFGD